MDKHAQHYFCEGGEFSQVRALHEERAEPYDDLCLIAPQLPKGWWELSHLQSADRIEFIRSYWQSALPYIPHIDHHLCAFFQKLDDIGIFLVQRRETDPLQAVMVFSELHDAGFFCGLPPLSTSEQVALQQAFPDLSLPEDYLAFLRIHNGFHKLGDAGIISSWQVPECCQHLWQLLEEREPLSHPTNPQEWINPQMLIPFYRSGGVESFQCFFTEWYPQDEMGNLYYSGIDHTLSDLRRGRQQGGNFSFPTFLDWLSFYLDLPLS